MQKMFRDQLHKLRTCFTSDKASGSVPVRYVLRRKFAPEVASALAAVKAVQHSVFRSKSAKESPHAPFEEPVDDCAVARLCFSISPERSEQLNKQLEAVVKHIVR